jgi:hypothetical protein
MERILSATLLRDFPASPMDAPKRAQKSMAEFNYLDQV